MCVWRSNWNNGLRNIVISPAVDPANGVDYIFTRDALKGHTASKNGSISFFFFFLVVTNLYINLFIKPSFLLLGMYCSDCLQQKQANQNPFLPLISRGRGPTHPYLCDVNASFDFFIKNGLNCGAIIIVNMLWTQVCRFQTEISPF